MYPRYLNLTQNQSLDDKIDKAFKLLESCGLCAHRCKVNRLKGQQGRCKSLALPKICSYFAHHGEEPPVSGKYGSGTIFFSNCNLSCVYCQNYQFSQLGEGKEVSEDKLAEMMLELQNLKVHNINLVTPTHFIPQILKSLKIAIAKGLNLPLVYNTSGYETLEALRLLDGIVDVYLTDMRYANADEAKKYSNAPNYPQVNQTAVKEMFRQVGDAEFRMGGEAELIKTGLIIRLLVLPNNIASTVETLRFIKQNISPHTYVSLMSQYSPYYRAKEFKSLNRRITKAEYAVAAEEMKRLKLNGWIQEDYGLDSLAGVHIKKAL